MKTHYIKPQWSAPNNVKAYATTRQGGYSQAPFNGFNLALHVDDDPLAVAKNRQLLQQQLQLPTEPVWLEQVHSDTIYTIKTQSPSQPPIADASVTTVKNQVCIIMTADCLPVLFCDRQGTCVATAHAGWRGLLDGILEKTVATMPCDNGEIIAWLGAGISAEYFEIGDEVRDLFIADMPTCQSAFVPHSTGHWLADLYQLARLRLQAIGVTQIEGGNDCTYKQTDLFFSYRRQHPTGRMASLIYLS